MNLVRRLALPAVTVLLIALIPAAVAASAPNVSGSAPAFARPGVAMVYRDLSTDADGDLVLREWDMENDGIVDYTNPSSPFSHAYASAGTYIGLQRATDAASNVATRNFMVIVDGDAPVSTILAPAVPASGWYGDDVALTIKRADTGGSGLATTRITLDGGLTAIGGKADISLTVSGDGEHSLSVSSLDIAGNVETPITMTIRIDGSLPDVKVTSPGPAGAAPGPAIHGGAAMVGDTIPLAASATDAHSGVNAVAFTVDGVVVGVDSTSGDGFTASWDTTGRNPGSYEIRATGTNGAGLVGFSSVALVLAPVPPVLGASAGIGASASNDCDLLISAACSGGDSAGVSGDSTGASSVDEPAPFGFTQFASAFAGLLSDSTTGGAATVGGGASAAGAGAGCAVTVADGAATPVCSGVPATTVTVGIVGKNNCSPSFPTPCEGGDSATVTLGGASLASADDVPAPFGLTQGAGAWLGNLVDGGTAGHGGVFVDAAGCHAQTWGGEIHPSLEPVVDCGLA